MHTNTRRREYVISCDISDQHVFLGQSCRFKSNRGYAPYNALCNSSLYYYDQNFGLGHHYGEVSSWEWVSLEGSLGSTFYCWLTGLRILSSRLRPWSSACRPFGGVVNWLSIFPWRFVGNLLVVSSIFYWWARSAYFRACELWSSWVNARSWDQVSMDFELLYSIWSFSYRYYAYLCLIFGGVMPGEPLATYFRVHIARDFATSITMESFATHF